MKQILLPLLSILLAVGSQATDHPKQLKLNAAPSATFDSIWVDYDITENDVLGMRIHLQFSTYGMKDMDAYVAIFFEYNDDMAGFLKDKNKKFQSSEGDVALYKAIKPAYDPADYKDLTLFMPYNEFDLEPGIYDLTMDTKIIFKQGGLLQWLTYYDFEYTKPGSPADVESATKADAVLEDLTVDYDVTENGKKGMRIHVKFTTYNLKDVDSYLALYFEQKNGEKLEGGSTGFRSKSGQLAVYKSLKPAFPEAVYKDLQLFMPYDEINLPKGKYDLRMKVDLILKNGDMIKHLKDYDFWFTR
jgi:hypothetical protein